MISPKFYELIYTTFIILFCIPSIRKLSTTSYFFGYTYKDAINNAILLLVLVVLFVGFRPNSMVFSDGAGYWQAMIDHRWEGVWGHDWKIYKGEGYDNYFIFSHLMAFMSSIGVSPRLCFIVLDLIIYGFAFLALRKMFPNDITLAFLLYCGTFGTFSFATNGLKNGCSMSLFLCALAYKDNWMKCAGFMLLSLGFHHSMQLSIVAFMACLLYKNTKTYIYFWCFSLIIAMAHITFFQTLFAGYTDDHAAGYLVSDVGVLDYSSGFRLDFILYSAAPVALGWWVIIKQKIVSPDYSFILNVYLLINSIWMLCMYSNFTNRIAQLSWSLFPVLIIYPLTKLRIAPNQNQVLKWYVVGQLSFTLLLSLYYTITVYPILSLYDRY